jgi:hypothetical protein
MATHFSHGLVAYERSRYAIRATKTWSSSGPAGCGGECPLQRTALSRFCARGAPGLRELRCRTCGWHGRRQERARALSTKRQAAQMSGHKAGRSGCPHRTRSMGVSPATARRLPNFGAREALAGETKTAAGAWLLIQAGAVAREPSSVPVGSVCAGQGRARVLKLARAPTGELGKVRLLGHACLESKTGGNAPCAPPGWTLVRAGFGLRRGAARSGRKTKVAGEKDRQIAVEQEAASIRWLQGWAGPGEWGTNPLESSGALLLSFPPSPFPAPRVRTLPPSNSCSGPISSSRTRLL